MTSARRGEGRCRPRPRRSRDGDRGARRRASRRRTKKIEEGLARPHKITGNRARGQRGLKNWTARSCAWGGKEPARLAVTERSEVLALAGLHALLARVQTVLAVRELADHDDPQRCNARAYGLSVVPTEPGSRTARTRSPAPSLPRMWIAPTPWSIDGHRLLELRDHAAGDHAVRDRGARLGARELRQPRRRIVHVAQHARRRRDEEQRGRPSSAAASWLPTMSALML